MMVDFGASLPRFRKPLTEPARASSFIRMNLLHRLALVVILSNTLSTPLFRRQP